MKKLTKPVFFRNGVIRIRIATRAQVAIEVEEITGIATRLSAMPIEAQMTTSPNAKSLRVHTMRIVIIVARTSTTTVQSACVYIGMPGISTFRTDAILAMIASEIQPR